MRCPRQPHRLLVGGTTDKHNIWVLAVIHVYALLHGRSSRAHTRPADGLPGRHRRDGPVRQQRMKCIPLARDRQTVRRSERRVASTHAGAAGCDRWCLAGLMAEPAPPGAKGWRSAQVGIRASGEWVNGASLWPVKKACRQPAGRRPRRAGRAPTRRPSAHEDGNGCPVDPPHDQNSASWSSHPTHGRGSPASAGDPAPCNHHATTLSDPGRVSG